MVVSLPNISESPSVIQDDESRSRDWSRILQNLQNHPQNRLICQKLDILDYLIHSLINIMEISEQRNDGTNKSFVIVVYVKL